MAISEAQKRASKKYEAGNCVRLNLKLNKKTDADVLWIDIQPHILIDKVNTLDEVKQRGVFVARKEDDR